jgi:hypothetical protein
MCTTAAEVLERFYPGFQWPLDRAIEWFKDGRVEMLREAIELLRGLRREYPDAPQIGQWLVLTLIEADQPAEAETELAATERLFHNPDEELLSRWGRLFRERGDENAKHLPENEADRQIAIHHYRKARDKYVDAAAVRHGHYPRINVAELSLILAGLDAPHREQERHRAEETAAELVATRENWHTDVPADEFWHLATEAQCQMLLGNWELATGLYQQACSHRLCHDRDRASIRGGCQRTKQAFRRLGVTNFGPLDDEDGVFAP